MPKATNWQDVREWYITSSLSCDPGEVITLKDVANKFKVTYGTVRNHAYKEDWKGLLASAEEKRDTHIREGVVKRSAAVAEVVNEDAVNKEANVRRRQAAVSRVLQGKAAQRLRYLDPAELSVREAIDLMRLGLVEERRALGVADRLEVVTVGDDPPPEHIPTARAREVLGRVLQMVETKQGVYESEHAHDDDPGNDDS